MIPRTGPDTLLYTDPAHPHTPLTVYTYRPAAYQPHDRVVVVHHGMMRNGDEYRDSWIEAAEAHRLLIVAPTFGADAFPEPENYNNGKVLAADGSVTPREQWLYAIPSRVLQTLRKHGVTQRKSAYLFGHSAGGQFAHRLVATQGADAWERVSVGNPGWYTLPTLDRPFPEGLGGLGLSEADVHRWLAVPMCILAGDRDTDPSDPSLPREPAAQAQGPTRFARAHYFFEFAQTQATKLGVPCHWSLVPVHQVGHDGFAMGRAAAGRWFAGEIKRP